MMKKQIALGLLGATFCPSLVSGQAVDVHSHIVVPEYVETLKAHDAELEETFPVPHWDVNRHIAFMDSAGISPPHNPTSATQKKARRAYVV